MNVSSIDGSRNYWGLVGIRGSDARRRFQALPVQHVAFDAGTMVVHS